MSKHQDNTLKNKKKVIQKIAKNRQKKVIAGWKSSSIYSALEDLVTSVVAAKLKKIHL